MAAPGLSISASPTLRPVNGVDIGAVELGASELPNNGRCAGRLATIIAGGRKVNGTNGPDAMARHQRQDVIRGGGKDRICGLGGRDRLLGGGGRDRLLGGRGRDILIGGPGRDALKGGPGRDSQRQ